jgi:hypothetical protein
MTELAKPPKGRRSRRRGGLPPLGAAPIDSSRELWRAIIARGGLDVERYDRAITTELAHALGLPGPDGFDMSLERHGVTVESLLTALLSAVAPYAAMLQEIFSFFSDAGARASEKELAIRFDFDEARDLDLDDFRDWAARLDASTSVVDVPELSPLAGLELRHVFVRDGITYRIENGAWIDVLPADRLLRAWLDRPRSALPPRPAVEDLELRKLLDQVWALLRASESTGLFGPEDVRTIVRGTSLLLAAGVNLTSPLRELLDGRPVVPTRTEHLFECLEEILSLPAWELRSEVYSVWAGTRLIGAMGESARVHHVDGSIFFSPLGSHLATCPVEPAGNAHVIAELQTELTAAKPLGKGRSTRIRPDYVVSGEPIGDARTTLLVVECKQYLRQKRKNFSEALIDYARGHPEAPVVLVNYGPTTPSVLERVDELAPDVSGRTKVVGRFRPDCPEALAAFARTVRAAVPVGEPPAPAVAPTNLVPADQVDHASQAREEVGSLSLTWGAVPADLDLHAWVRADDGSVEHVSFQQRTASGQGIDPTLDRDVTDVHGPETLRWARPPGVTLTFAVHNFSDERPLAACAARIALATSTVRLELEIPRSGTGRWWRLLTVDATGVLHPLNALSDTPPLPIS